ncbi:MAG: T9SS type A sorting domain-containing protein [Bacteroidia bacterium]|nr:T9SS type A sorting domain-containing protein [Bacteroidia bacterium]
MPRKGSGVRKTTFEFYQSGRDVVSVLVTDLLGRVVITAVDNAEFPAGTHVLPLYVADLPTGIYLLQLRGGGDVRTRRILVLR